MKHSAPQNSSFVTSAVLITWFIKRIPSIMSAPRNSIRRQSSEKCKGYITNIIIVEMFFFLALLAASSILIEPAMLSLLICWRWRLYWDPGIGKLLLTPLFAYLFFVCVISLLYRMANYKEPCKRCNSPICSLTRNWAGYANKRNSVNKILLSTGFVNFIQIYTN